MLLLFITRKWRGRGGMQQLSRDLWYMLEKADGIGAHLCAPDRSWFLYRLVRDCWRAGRRGWHIHLGDAALAPLGASLKFIFKVRVTVTACGLDVIYPLSIYQWLLRRSLLYLDHVVCISHATGHAVRERGVADEQMTVIPCGMWPKSRQDSIGRSRHMRLLSIGRLVPRKGIAWFLRDVFPRIIAIIPDVTFDIVGDGPEYGRIEKIIDKHEWHDRVRLHGAVDDARRDQFLDSADVFVMPTVHRPGDMEGFGIVCIEASAVGVPVAAAAIDGVCDAVIDGKTGRLFVPGDPNACAEAVIALLRSNPNRDAIRMATREMYSWEKLGPRFCSAISDGR